MMEKQVTRIKFVEFEKVPSEEYCYHLLAFIFYCATSKHS